MIGIADPPPPALRGASPDSTTAGEGEAGGEVTGDGDASGDAGTTGDASGEELGGGEGEGEAVGVAEVRGAARPGIGVLGVDDAATWGSTAGAASGSVSELAASAAARPRC